MFVYNGANHETHGDHISRHGETQNQKAISVAFVRCQFIAACCPWQVKRKTSSGKRYSVSNALMDFFGDHLVNLCPFLHRGKSRRRRIKRSNDPSAIHSTKLFGFKYRIMVNGTICFGMIIQKDARITDARRKARTREFQQISGPRFIGKQDQIDRTRPVEGWKLLYADRARLSSRRNAPMARWKKVGRGKEIHSKKFW